MWHSTPSRDTSSSMRASFSLASSLVRPTMSDSPWKNFTSYGSRPYSAASERVSSIRPRADSGFGLEMKTPSALRAENRCPTGEAPAWNSTGVRCGDGVTKCGPSTE